eukprot:NODE_779_length_1200_cov_96.660764_g738_i0.p1 GENE.NODE_779_length_1200_cov_96.660764_g738_i0~~NODE_779_length_1200_cov_96.660764_g738_i0.p1  ORF type:complete len:176 (-),score=14.36 NODE_779_length_1200_cov_96.660764_g738_i0:590-1117(-)
MASPLCIITGAARGFGAELAYACARILPEPQFLLASRSNPETTIARLRGIQPGARITHAAVDMADVSSVTTAVQPALQESSASCGSVYLFHNAGSQYPFGALVETSIADVRESLVINIESMLQVTRLVTDVLPPSGDRPLRVVNISSLCSIHPRKTLGMYCITKAARDMLMRVLL